jgi:TRAP-type C4-dicarboxylate transport system permease small subunit
MCLFVTAEILGRLAFNHSFMGIADIVDQCVLLVSYLSLGVIQRDRQHIYVDLLPKKIESRRSGPILDCVFLGLGALLAAFLTGEILWHMVYTYTGDTRTMTLFMPHWPFVAFMAIGMLLLMLRQIIQFKQSFIKALHFGRGPSAGPPLEKERA